MFKLYRKDKNLRKKIKLVEKKQLITKSICRNTLLKISIRLNSNYIQNKMISLNNGSKHKTVNRCIVTGRKSKIHKKFRFSRISFLNIARSGVYNGIKKVTW